MDPSQEQKSSLKLAQLYRALQNKYQDNMTACEKIIEKEGDIDYAFPADGPCMMTRSHYAGYTALHLACESKNIKLFNKLLDCGADFTKKNKDGKTVLHMSIIQPKFFDGLLDCVFIDSVLTAHMERHDFSNPCDKDGFSHFHVACMSSNARAVKFFLDNGALVDEPTDKNAKFLPGCTPLHIAASFTSTTVAEILLTYGANVHMIDAHEKTPLHILIEHRMKMVDFLACGKLQKDDIRAKLQTLIKENDKIMNMIMENTSTDNDSLDHIGLSNLHVSCLLEDTSIAERLADQTTNINHCENEDSKLWPGYTALHFAAHFSPSAVEMLMKKGAKFELKDVKGVTPLDICVERFSIEDICSIMSVNENWKQILLSDGETELVSLISATADIKRFKKFMNFPNKDANIFIPMESALWPGYTLLHLAVLFAEPPKLIFSKHREKENETGLQIIRFCLSQGADVSTQDSRGRTPLHLAFRLNKRTVIDVIFRHCREIPNKLDEENLSHLHIVCATSNKKHKLRKCAALSVTDTNVVYKGTAPINSVKPGSTPLHVLVVNHNSCTDDDSEHAIMTLLKHGADINIKDAYGLTPVHWLLPRFYRQPCIFVAKRLLKRVSNDCVANEYRISYLHVACQLDNYATAKRLLGNGADVNLAISYTRRDDKDPLSCLSHYDKYTPLHISGLLYSLTAEKLVLEHGANVFAEKADGSTALESPSNLKHFISKLRDDVELQNRLSREFGWTKLHLACLLSSSFITDERIQDITGAELADVNARVFSNSPLWKGYTPLHVLMYGLTNYWCYEHRIYFLSEILLEKGADVTIVADDQNSPLGMLFDVSASDKYDKQAALMMKFHKNFNVNPMNTHGISHFHIACHVNDAEAVKGFLLKGVDVNHPIDYFNTWYPGYTPLHLASKLPVVDLLIDHGADVHIEDVNGCTALHKAASRDCFDERVIAKIIEAGAEINKPNFQGTTPFESAITDSEMTIDKLQFFIERGFLVNSCNSITGIGYISLVLRKYYRDEKVQIAIVEVMMREDSINVFGRTTLHHLVTGSWSNNYVVFIENLLESGHDIDEQDDGGKTALHLAVEFRDSKAVDELLVSGADINVLDSKENSALSLAMAYLARSNPNICESDSISDILIIHACRLTLLKLDLNQLNANTLFNISQSLQDYAGRREFLEELERSKQVEIGVRGMRLSDFLCETSAVLVYPTLNQLERQRVNEFFESINNDDRVQEIRSFLKLQYRKAIKRPDFIAPATNSLRSLLGFDLPDLCAENIFLYLSNSSLKNLIEAGFDIENMRMEVD